MRVGIIQSNFIPWRGYFDFIDDVDTFIILDDVQYTKSDWRNRNKLKTKSGTSWITVPVRRDGLQTRIDEARIDWSKPWPQVHRHLIFENYRDAPYVEDIAASVLSEIDRRPENLSALNYELIKFIAARLSIETKFVFSTELDIGGSRTDRLVSLVRAVGGTSYLSGPAAEAYLDVDAFKKANIALEYKSYDYQPYPQLWGSFDGAVSIIDLLMNTGPDARNFLKSRTPNRRIA